MNDLDKELSSVGYSYNEKNQLSGAKEESVVFIRKIFIEGDIFSAAAMASAV